MIIFQVNLLALLVFSISYVNCDMEYANVHSSEKSFKVDNKNINTASHMQICSGDVKLFSEILLYEIDTNKDSCIDKQELHDAFFKQIKYKNLTGLNFDFWN